MKKLIWPLAPLLEEMDETIEWYDTANKFVEKECGYVDGKLKDRANYESFVRRRDNLRESYHRKMQDCYDQLHDKAKVISHMKVNVQEYLNHPLSYMRKNVCVGEAKVNFYEIDKTVPISFKLPLAAPISVPQNSGNLITRLLYRVIFTFPLGKCQLFAYDPNHFGPSLGRLGCLLDVEEVFPQQKVMLEEDELKSLIGQLKNQFAALQQRFIQTQCRDWQDYNHRMRMEKTPQKLLPYRILICFDLPSGCNADTLELLMQLANEGERYGFLLLFSYDPVSIEVPPANPGINILQNDLSDEGKILKYLYESSVNIFQETGSFMGIKGVLSLSHIKARILNLLDMPNEADVERDYRIYRRLIEENRGKSFTFEDLLHQQACFSGSAVNGISIPLGERESDGTLLELSIDDAVPHVLIGGATGSGKSVLQHVLILNACWKYSPDELALYLLDFKNAVEFTAYTKPCLPHADLVATKADPDFALDVLRHLVQELQDRNQKFKEAGVSDYKKFRLKCPAVVLPRILLIIDEVQLMFSSDPIAVMQQLKVLAQQGRSAGIHMILAAQSFRTMNAGEVISFNDIKGQFQGKLALYCVPEDSYALLGMGNDAAASLKRGEAILNTGYGISDNQKFRVPYATEKQRQDCLEFIASKAGLSARKTRIYSGAQLPPFPTADDFYHKNLQMLVGEKLTYEAGPFRIPLVREINQNILLCGRKGSLMDDIVVIGDYDHLFSESHLKKSVHKFLNPMDFFYHIKDENTAVRHFIVMNGCLFTASYSIMPNTDESAMMQKFEMLPMQGSHILAYYPSLNQEKSSHIPDSWFDHRLASGLPPSQLALLSGDQLGLPQGDKKSHLGQIAYIYQEKISWFRPFAPMEDDHE